MTTVGMGSKKTELPGDDALKLKIENGKLKKTNEALAKANSDLSAEIDSLKAQLAESQKPKE